MPEPEGVHDIERPHNNSKSPDQEGDAIGFGKRAGYQQDSKNNGEYTDAKDKGPSPDDLSQR